MLSRTSFLFLLACTPKDEPSDTGTDTDTDSGTGSSPSLQGTSTRTVLIDGVEVCTETYELVGTPYEGDCPDCRFAFSIEASPPQGSGQCPPNPRLTWASDPMAEDIRLALTESDEVLWGSSSPVMTYYGGTAPPADWEPAGPGSWDGETLELQTQLHHEEFEYNPDIFQECGEVAYPGLPAVGPTEDTPGAVRCDLSTFDLYVFEAEQGAVLRLWADTGPEEWVELQLGVTDAETCLLAVGAPSFPCAASPGTQPAQCPGLEIVIPAAGTYRVILAGESEPCAGGSADYVLRGNLDDVPILFSQELDDASTGQPVVIEEHASLVAHVQL